MEIIRNHYSVYDMKKFSFEILKKGGYSDESAQATTFALLEADIRGIYSHGIAGGTGLEEAVKRTGITATVDLKVEPIILDKKYPTIAVIDGNGAPGHITAMKAVLLVKELARKYGIAKVFVQNTNHYGAAGVWSSLIAKERDLKGEVSCTTTAVARVMGDDPERLDYTKGSGKEIRIGTNPLAISIPYSEGILTLDMALTRMAVSYCLKQFKAGEMVKIPEYVSDKNYKSTRDPKEFIETDKFGLNIIGSVFPLGSTLAGYKGDALLRFLEIDQSIGGGPINKIPLEDKGIKRRISHSFQAQVMDFLYSKDEARTRVKELMQDYESKYFGSSSRWPGDRAEKAKGYSYKEGIPYSKGQIKTLQRAAEFVGLNFEEILKPIGKKAFPENIFNK
ncbi:MAG: Malate/(S)-sulfolactate dehydrogenase [Candidatus Heimdallarchaeota archaeon LC_3]|nr:MAG: Malate/(S)-sulfolactate dehydrogenase [Candidatus Heimdallarchaeota archaeon LC_3]